MLKREKTEKCFPKGETENKSRRRISAEISSHGLSAVAFFFSLLTTRNWEIPLGQTADATRLRERIVRLPLVHGRPCVKSRVCFHRGFPPEPPCPCLHGRLPQDEASVRKKPTPIVPGGGGRGMDTIDSFIWSSRRPDSRTIKPKRRTSQMIRKELA